MKTPALLPTTSSRSQLVLCGATLLVTTAAFGVLHLNAGEAANPPLLDRSILREGGDCLRDEVLAWERLRAERRTAIEQDDSPPIAWVDHTGRIYLATASGKLAISDDGGQSFSPPRPIALSPGMTVPCVRAMAVLRSDGPDRPERGRASDPILIACHVPSGELQCARSDDEGQTWSVLSTIDMKGNLDRSTVARMVQLADGTLMLALPGDPGMPDAEGWVYASNDQGRSWSKRAGLGVRCAGASLLVLRSGELLAAIAYRGAAREGDPRGEISRDELFDHIVVARSRDGGKSWREPQFVTRYRESPADLTELADGRVLLTYGQQNFPYGARAIVSDDGGRTWGKHVYVLGFSTVQLSWSSSPKITEPGWHASSVAVGTESILTFYTRGSLIVSDEYVLTLGHERQQVEELKADGALGEKGRSIVSVRWALKGLEKSPLSYPGAMGRPDADGYVNNGRVQIKPEHLNWGGDYFSDDEILRYRRISAEHHKVARGAGATAALDPDGHPVLCLGNGKIYRSRDGARSWQPIGATPVAGWVSSFGILRDGALLALIGLDVYRSEDGGQNWSGPARLEMPGYFDAMGPDECQRINQLPDGTVLVSVCGGNSHAPGMRGAEPSMVYRSRDGGRTWGDWSFGGGHNLLRLKSGRLLGAFRHERQWGADDLIAREAIPQNKHRPMLYRVVSFTSSDDNGYLWSIPKTVTRYNETPGDLAELPDGTLVLTYHNKNNITGARALISRDAGRTWDKTLYMLDWSSRSGGFTSSVVLPDGRILTADNGWSPRDNDMVTEVTLWSPLTQEQLAAGE